MFGKTVIEVKMKMLKTHGFHPLWHFVTLSSDRREDESDRREDGSDRREDGSDRREDGSDRREDGSLAHDRHWTAAFTILDIRCFEPYQI